MIKRFTNMLKRREKLERKYVSNNDVKVVINDTRLIKVTDFDGHEELFDSVDTIMIKHPELKKSGILKVLNKEQATHYSYKFEYISRIYCCKEE